MKTLHIEVCGMQAKVVLEGNLDWNVCIQNKTEKSYFHLKCLKEERKSKGNKNRSKNQWHIDNMGHLKKVTN